MEIYYITIVFIMHCIGDLTLQTEWMGLRKSKEWCPLFAHVAIYTGTLFVFSSFVIPSIALIWSCINGILHLLVDYFSSRAIARAREEGNVYKFYSFLILDQAIHFVCLIGILAFLI